MKKQDICVPR